MKSRNGAGRSLPGRFLHPSAFADAEHNMRMWQKAAQKVVAAAKNVLTR
jgi:hypothetical protein